MIPACCASRTSRGSIGWEARRSAPSTASTWKSTLLNLLAGLDRPTSGRILTPAGDLSELSRRGLAAWRAQHVGMVFQTFNLVPHRTALQNVELALLFVGVARAERDARARQILERMGLGSRLAHRPADLSGGEQQRVALARALVKRPRLLLADEPTGNLDRENAAAIAGFLAELSRDGITVVLVTHDAELAAADVHRTVRMHYGKATDEPRSESVAVPSSAQPSTTTKTAAPPPLSPPATPDARATSAEAP
jgi:putative ABC transport system ATP-binding protein